MSREGKERQCRRNPLEAPGETPRSVTPGPGPPGALGLPSMWHSFTEHLPCLGSSLAPHETETNEVCSLSGLSFQVYRQWFCKHKCTHQKSSVWVRFEKNAIILYFL